MGISMTGMYLGAVSPIVLGFLINKGGGWNSYSGYITGLYFLASCMVIAFLFILFFTRETVGKKRGKDWSLVKKNHVGLNKKQIRNQILFIKRNLVSFTLS